MLTLKLSKTKVRSYKCLLNNCVVNFVHLNSEDFLALQTISDGNFDYSKLGYNEGSSSKIAASKIYVDIGFDIQLYTTKPYTHFFVNDDKVMSLLVGSFCEKDFFKSNFTAYPILNYGCNFRYTPKGDGSGIRKLLGYNVALDAQFKLKNRYTKKDYPVDFESRGFTNNSKAIKDRKVCAYKSCTIVFVIVVLD